MANSNCQYHQGDSPMTRTAAANDRQARMSVVLAGALLIAVTALLTGCGTLTTPHGRLPAAPAGTLALVPQGQAEEPDLQVVGLPRAPEFENSLTQFRQAFAAGHTLAGRIAAMAALQEALDGWRAANPTAAATTVAAISVVTANIERSRVRLEFEEATAAAMANVAAAATPSEAIAASERFLCLLAAAAQSPHFSTDERQRFALLRDTHTRRRAAAQVVLAWDRAGAALRDPASLDQTLQACSACDQALAEAIGLEVADTAARTRFETMRFQLAAARADTQRQFTAILADLHSQQEELQRQFVNGVAATDYQRARELYDAEAAKWLNWGMLSHWRDQLGNLVLAATFCDRIGQEDRVDYMLRNGASDLRANIASRFDADGNSRYANAPGLPAYTSLGGYPRTGESDMCKEAERLWLRTRRFVPEAPPEIPPHPASS